ncbi:MAG: flippase activity-associated protein Agl23 [Haloferacaceae archaeon]
MADADGPDAGRTRDDDARRVDPAADDGVESTVDDALDALPVDRTTLAVLAVVALALAVRLYRLGARIMHWDEGRVGYWILRYHETGQFHYRPIVHGPFLPVVNDYVFAVLAPTDFSARLVVALVGGLLPLAALLFRERLRGSETAALALVLAVNPLLVYYSRFMRNDVLVGAFALVALGFAVRALDRNAVRPAYVGAVALALAFTAKENALIYVVCFLGAAGLLLDHRLVRRTTAGESVRDVLAGWGRTAVDRLRRRGRPLYGFAPGLLHAAGLLVAFFGVVTFFYAPRPALWTALASPAALPGVVEAATVGSWEAFYSTWIGGGHQSNPYVPFLYDYLETLAYGAPAVLAFAAVGFVVDGYGDEGGRRDLVAFATYWGAVSVLGYPIATDIRAPWAVVHAVVPLAIPAAVGLAYLYRRADLSLAPDREAASGPILAALLVLAAATGVAGANGAYMNSASDAEGEVLQYAQPGNDLKATLEEVERAVRNTDDGPAPDVLFVGTTQPGGSGVLFYVENESTAAQPPVGGPNWHSRLPLPWYLERYGAEVTSTAPDESLPDDPPPVVIAYAWDRDEVSEGLDGYVAREHRFRLWSERIVVFVDRSALR